MDRKCESITPFRIPLLAIKGAICQACFNPAKQLNKCAACKRVSYCSKSCQTKQWKSDHKRFCQRIRNCGINDVEKMSSNSSRTWQDHRDDTLRNITSFKALFPDYRTDDQRIVIYEPYCGNCYRTSFQLLLHETLQVCEGCGLAHHCTSCSAKSKHSPEGCRLFLKIRDAEELAIFHFLETGKTSIIIPTNTARTNYAPLSNATGWYDYFTRISDKEMLRGMVSTELEPLPGDDANDAKRFLQALIASTNATTIPLTIIAALEKVLPDIASKTTVNLHFVGANSIEIDALMLLEELHHLLPRLHNLHCTFIGLELPKVKTERMEQECCPRCTSAGRTRSVSFWLGKYHDYAKSSEYEQPDMAVAFHSGHSQEALDQWRPTITYLAEADHCTVFTCYNKVEVEEEVEILKKLGAFFVQTSEINKWRGLAPQLEALETIENSVFYMNYYWYIIGQPLKS